jgi:hypothetical protein
VIEENAALESSGCITDTVRGGNILVIVIGADLPGAMGADAPRDQRSMGAMHTWGKMEYYFF